MHIDFDEYPTYSGAIPQFFEQISMPIFSVIMATFIRPSRQSKTTF